MLRSQTIHVAQNRCEHTICYVWLRVGNSCAFKVILTRVFSRAFLLKLLQNDVDNVFHDC
jgi:hypothetical protein